MAEEWGFVFNGLASAGTGRGGEVGDDEEGARGVGDPGEAAEIREEREGAVIGGGRRRDQMRWMEGERELRQRVLLPHRAGYCMSVGAGGGSVEFGSSPVATADLPFSSRRPQGLQILSTELYNAMTGPGYDCRQLQGKTEKLGTSSKDFRRFHCNFEEEHIGFATENMAA